MLFSLSDKSMSLNRSLFLKLKFLVNHFAYMRPTGSFILVIFDSLINLIFRCFKDLILSRYSYPINS